MDFEAIIRVVGVAASVAVPVFVHLRTHPRRRVSYVLDERPAPPGVVAPDGRSLNLVTVRLWASGRTDISSTDFDGQKAIVFQFNGAIVDAAAPPDESQIEGWGFERAKSNQVVLQPSLLPRRSVYSTTVALPAPVHYWVRHPLLNIPMVVEPAGPGDKTSRRGASRFRITALSAGITLSVVGFVGGIALLPLVADYNSLAVSLYALASVLQTVGFFMVAISLIVRIVRFAARRRSQAAVSGDPQSHTA